MNPRRLYRCRHDRQLAGVASGMAEYLDIDPTVVRILWILSAFLGGFTILLYIILAFIVPLEPASGPAPAGARPAGPAWACPRPGRRPGRTGSSPRPSPARPSGFADDPARATAGAGEPGTAWTAAGDPGAAWPASSAAWATPDQRTDDRRGGGVGLFVGVLLVVFGAIAMANMLIPGWAVAGLLWPAFVVALGVALLVVPSAARPQPAIGDRRRRSSSSACSWSWAPCVGARVAGRDRGVVAGVHPLPAPPGHLARHGGDPPRVLGGGPGASSFVSRGVLGGRLAARHRRSAS